MSETAATQFNRLVQMVAELSREEKQNGEGVPIPELASRYGVSPDQVNRDIRTLTDANDHPDTEWLQSLAVWQEGDRVSVSSQGPYRRPLRLTPDELLAIQVGLAMLDEEAPARLAGLLGRQLDAPPPQVHAAAAPGAWEAHVVDTARSAAACGRVLTIVYAGERDAEGKARAVEPREVVSANGRFYISAWCRTRGDWRIFRADRVLDARLEDETFEPREEMPTSLETATFSAGSEEPLATRVRFSPRVARWLAERYPDAERLPDGSLEVTYRVSEPRWLARTVLQYADEAEVVAPPEMREMMARALGGAA